MLVLINPGTNQIIKKSFVNENSSFGYNININQHIEAIYFVNCKLFLPVSR
jgi:hypothetical protein